jgi:hypothetical protein
VVSFHTDAEIRPADKKAEQASTCSASFQYFYNGQAFCDAMAKQKFRPTRLGGFSGTKAYF